jgi:hypothetical protein
MNNTSLPEAVITAAYNCWVVCWPHEWPLIPTGEVALVKPQWGADILQLAPQSFERGDPIDIGRVVDFWRTNPLVGRHAGGGLECVANALSIADERYAFDSLYREKNLRPLAYETKAKYLYRKRDRGMSEGNHHWRNFYNEGSNVHILPIDEEGNTYRQMSPAMTWSREEILARKPQYW